MKKLISREVALGIGRKATKEELDQYLDRGRSGKFKSLTQVRKELITYLQKRNNLK